MGSRTRRYTLLCSDARHLNNLNPKMLDWYQAYDRETFLHRFSEIDYRQYNILA